MSSLKFRVLIDTTDAEEVFRDIIIAGTDDFESFYNCIIKAFEFQGNQLASFYLSNDNWDKGKEIALLDMGMTDNPDGPLIMKNTIIQDTMESKDQKLILVYDFMKMWCFLVELIEELSESTEGPEITFKVGKPPDEDSKELDMSSEMGISSPMDLGNDIDDIFSDFENEDDDGTEFGAEFQLAHSRLSANLQPSG